MTYPADRKRVSARQVVGKNLGDEHESHDHCHCCCLCCQTPPSLCHGDHWSPKKTTSTRRSTLPGPRGRCLPPPRPPSALCQLPRTAAPLPYPISCSDRPSPFFFFFFSLPFTMLQAGRLYRRPESKAQVLPGGHRVSGWRWARWLLLRVRQLNHEQRRHDMNEMQTLTRMGNAIERVSVSCFDLSEETVPCFVI